MKRILATLLMGLMLIIQVPPATAEDYSTLAQSITIIQPSRCTAFSINQEEGYWITARHCMDSPMGTVLGEDYTVIAETVEQDLVILESSAGRAKALRLEMRPPKIGDVTVAVGYAYGETPILYLWGRISTLRHLFSGAFWEYVMIVDGHTAPGMSGSPRLSSRLRVISVVQGSRTVPPYDSISIPWNELIRFAGPYWEH